MEPPSLPVDLQLEIIARSDDVATVLRCAAASKLLRGAILDPGFRRRLALRASANGGFDPALLVAVSYLFQTAAVRRDTAVSDHATVQPPWGLLQSFQLASARDGLLVLCRDRRSRVRGEQTRAEIRVCNTFTGHVASLPRTDLGRGEGNRGIFRPALLTLDGFGSSFELLAMEAPSQKGEWGDVRSVHLPLGYQDVKPTYGAPVVVGHTVHWLCHAVSESADAYSMIVLAVQADTAQAMAVELPQAQRQGYVLYLEKQFIMATTADGRRMSLLFAEDLVISMWTLTPDKGSSRWSRQVVIQRQEINKQLTIGAHAHGRILFDRFGERSGTVIFWMERVGLVQLNLGTKKARVLRRCGRKVDVNSVQTILHEIDLLSLLQDMKPF